MVWIGGVLLVCSWLIRSAFVPILPEAGSPPLIYSNQSRNDLHSAFLGAIRKSQESIFLVMFGLTDRPLLSLLSQKIGERLSTTIYYDPKGSPNIQKMLPGSDTRPVRVSGFMHHKALILDGETVFLGSANFTPTSLRMHDNLVIGLNSRTIARFLKEHLPSLPGHLQTVVGGQAVELWLLPDPRGHTLQDIRHRIKTAHRSIRAALFTLTHPLLLEDLIAAHQRGVLVIVAIDAHVARGASKQAVQTLRAGGVKVLLSQGAQLLHHKFAYIDGETLLAGSANWTKAAFCKNNDCFIALYHLTTSQKKVMDQIWGRIESQAL